MRLLCALTLPAFATAIRFPISARSLIEFETVSHQTLAKTGHEVALSSPYDLLYIANVTIDGNDYPLQMDTGSSDLWADMGSHQPSNPQSGLNVNITYGIGYAYGQIARGPVSFAGYDIPNQAYLQLQSGSNPVFQFGAKGIIGLGSTDLSLIYRTVQNKTGATWGSSLLYNIFSLYPSEPNYIAMSLGRSYDTATPVMGTFGIGEVEPNYSSVTSTNHIPLYPPNSVRWSVILDSFTVNGAQQQYLSKVSGVSTGSAVVVLDSGSSAAFVPPAVAAAIYGSVPGATLDTVNSQWVVPCKTEIRVTLYFDGRPFDIHPLDVVMQNYGGTGCVGGFMPTPADVDGVDMILGAAALRSIYAVYDFGDFDQNNQMGAPYVQLLSIVDADQAAAEFASVRNGSVSYLPKQGSAGSNNALEKSGDGNVDGDFNDDIHKLVKMAPVIFALLGGIAIILVILLVTAIWIGCALRKQGGSKGTVLVPKRKYQPVPRGEGDEYRSSVYSLPYNDTPELKKDAKA